MNAMTWMIMQQLKHICVEYLLKAFCKIFCMTHLLNVVLFKNFGVIYLFNFNKYVTYDKQQLPYVLEYRPISRISQPLINCPKMGQFCKNVFNFINFI